MSANEFAIKLDREESKPDHLDSISRAMRNQGDPAPYEGKDRSRGRTIKLPSSVLSFVYGILKRKTKFKCTNKNERKYYKRKFESCPVPSYRRFGPNRTRAPWYCVYCELRDNPDPPEK